MFSKPFFKKRRKETGTKYGSESTTCRAGHYHQSRLEADICNDLGILKQAGEIQTIETQKRFQLFGKNGAHICDHYVDFLCLLADGTWQAWEAKGFDTDTWVIKRKLFEDNYPLIKYVVKRKRFIK